MQIFSIVAFIKQKENDNNDNLCKIHDGLYIALALITFCSIKATRPKICKKSVCFYCITTSLWRTPVHHLTIFQFYMWRHIDDCKMLGQIIKSSVGILIFLVFICPSSDGTYYGMVMSVRVSVWSPSDSPSVRSPSARFPHFSPTCFDLLSCNFAHDFVLMYYRSGLSVVTLSQFLKELCLFVNLE